MNTFNVSFAGRQFGAIGSFYLCCQQVTSDKESLTTGDAVTLIHEQHKDKFEINYIVKIVGNGRGLDLVGTAWTLEAEVRDGRVVGFATAAGSAHTKTFDTLPSSDTPWVPEGVAHRLASLMRAVAP